MIQYIGISIGLELEALTHFAEGGRVLPLHLVDPRADPTGYALAEISAIAVEVHWPLGGGLRKIIFWLVCRWSRVNKLSKLLQLEGHVAEVSVELFLHLVCAHPWVLIWLWGVTLLLCERHGLAFGDLGKLVSIWAGIVFHSYISDL